MSALDDLAARCGIQHASKDVFGEEHETSPELKRALLAAMGYAADDDDQARATLDRLDAEEWQRGLPPVAVVYPGDDALTVAVTAQAGATPVAWTLTLENGEERSGEVRFSELRLLEERDIQAIAMERRLLDLGPREAIPDGYHRLRLSDHDEDCLVIATPGTCWLPQLDENERLWGLSVSLFTVRSGHNWGMGDFSDLRELATMTGEHGGDCLGLNPIHAMFLDKPEEASPYSPSDRTLLNVLYIDPTALPEFAACAAAQKLIAADHFQRRLEAARDSRLVEYETVAELKLAVLRLLFAEFEHQQDPARTREFEAFHQERRELLDRGCLFQALRSYFTSQSPDLTDYHAWPDEYRSSDSPAVAEFARHNAELVRFHLWLQWVADTQLRAASEAARDMRVGLYRDLAVGAHPSGAEVWAHPGQLVSGATVGAPPDIWSSEGQNWGLPPLHPILARRHGYASFIELLRANMRYAGALRLDHAMALLRLFWIPKGKQPKEGAYVHYEIEELVGILALESRRNRCMIVGEDLGTVPEGFRERMAEANILSYRVLFFEKEKRFLPPAEYPRLALAVAGNHDLPTVRGWWVDADLEIRERTGSLRENAREGREQDHNMFLDALRKEHLIGGERIDPDEINRASYAYLGRTNALLALVQLDDITGEIEQVNAPGTTGENPNWRRKLSLTLEELAGGSQIESVVEALGRGSRKEMDQAA